MSTIHTTTQTDPNGLLKLELPTGMASTHVDVTIVVEPTKAEQPVSQEQWLQFIEATAGKWQGELLSRPSQDNLENRDAWG